MLSQNSFEMEVNSRERAYGRDMVGDAEILAAHLFVLCCHGL